MITIGKAFQGGDLHAPEPDWAGLPPECGRCWDAPTAMTAIPSGEEICEDCIEEIASITKTPCKKITPKNIDFLKAKADAIRYADEREDRLNAQAWEDPPPKPPGQ